MAATASTRASSTRWSPRRLGATRPTAIRSARRPGAALAVPRLRRWHHLSFFKDASTLELLDRLPHGSLRPARMTRLVRIVKDDLGFPLHRAVERSKLALSARRRAPLCNRSSTLPPGSRAPPSELGRVELAAIDAVVSDCPLARRCRRRRRRHRVRHRRLRAGPRRSPAAGRAIRRSQARRRRGAHLGGVGPGGAGAAAVLRCMRILSRVRPPSALPKAVAGNSSPATARF